MVKVMVKESAHLHPLVVASLQTFCKKYGKIVEPIGLLKLFNLFFYYFFFSWSTDATRLFIKLRWRATIFISLPPLNGDPDYIHINKGLCYISLHLLPNTATGAPFKTDVSLETNNLCS